MSSLRTALRPLLVMLAVAAAPTPAQAAGFGLDRLELLNDDRGAWLNYELPMIAARPAATGVRYLTQLQLSWYVGDGGLTLQTGIDSQSISLEKSVNVDLAGGDLGWYGGVHTRLLMPRGVMAGLDWRKGKVRLSAGGSLTNASTWRRPSLKAWSVLPTLGVSVLFHERTKAKRYRGVPEDRSEFRKDAVDPLGRSYDEAEGTVLEAPPVAPGAVEEGASTEGVSTEGVNTEGAVLEGPPTEAPDAPAEGVILAPAPDAVTPPAEEGAVLEEPAEQGQPAQEIDESEAAPTGPTQVEFGGPMQVVLPGDDPVEVVIGGEQAPEEDAGDESSQGDDSSQNGDE